MRIKPLSIQTDTKETCKNGKCCFLQGFILETLLFFHKKTDNATINGLILIASNVLKTFIYNFKVVEKKAKDLIYTKTFLTPEICLSVEGFRNLLVSAGLD